MSRVLVLAALTIASVLAVLVLIVQADLSVYTLTGWLFAVLAVYFASLLVP